MHHRFHLHLRLTGDSQIRDLPPITMVNALHFPKAQAKYLKSALPPSSSHA